jgi:O-acetylserine/cysteine efflux transporter
LCFVLFNGLSTGLDLPTSVITSQLNAPFACILGMLFFRERIRAWRMLGMVIAFTGIIIVVGGTPNVSEHPKGFVLMLLTALSFAFANLIMKRMEGIPHMAMVGWMSLMAAPQLVFLSLFFEQGQWAFTTGINLSVISVLCYTAVFATIIAYSIWYALLSRYNVSQVVPFGLLVPIFATVGSQIFLDDTLAWPTVVGGVVTILGVAVIILPRPHFVQRLSAAKAAASQE